MSLASQVSALATRIGTEVKSIRTVQRVGMAPVVLTDAASVTINAALGNYFRLVAATTGTKNFLAPTNPTDGQTITIEVSATGGNRQLTFAQGSAGSWDGNLGIPVVRNNTTVFIRATYRTATTRWHVEPIAFPMEDIWVDTKTQRDALVWYQGLTVVRRDQGGFREWFDGINWHTNRTYDQVTLQSVLTDGASSSTEKIWASATIADPGHAYRIGVSVRSHVFINSGTMGDVRARVGPSSTADLSLPIVTYNTVRDNDTVGIFSTAPYAVSNILNGACRVVFSIQRTGGAGNYQIVANDAQGIYQMIPA